MKNVQHEGNMKIERNSKTRKECNTEKVHWKCTTRGKCNMEKVKHEKSATRKKCNIKIVQHEQSIVTVKNLQKVTKGEWTVFQKQINSPSVKEPLYISKIYWFFYFCKTILAVFLRDDLCCTFCEVTLFRHFSMTPDPVGVWVFPFFF